MAKEIKKILFSKIGWVLVGGLIVLGITNIGSFVRNSKSEVETSPAVFSNPNLDLNECNESKSIQETKKSVVRVITQNGGGSGFVIRSDGYIVTNYHVIQGEKAPKIVFADSTPVIATVFNWDIQTDLAVIKVEKDNLAALPFGESDKLVSGQTVYGIGYPLGEYLPGDASVSKGVFSAKRASDIAGLEYLQIDAALNPGNSGSPIIDSCGKVEGVLSLGIEGTEGLKFAISSKTAKSMVESLISTGPKSLSAEISSNYENETTPLSAVILYYDFISLRQFDLAYGLFSSNYKEQAGSLDNFKKGFEATLNVYIQDVRIEDADVPSVYVSVGTADLVGDKVKFRNFAGSWILVREDGLWKLDAAEISPVTYR